MISKEDESYLVKNCTVDQINDMFFIGCFSLEEIRHLKKKIIEEGESDISVVVANEKGDLISISRKKGIKTETILKGFKIVSIEDLKGIKDPSYETLN